MPQFILEGRDEPSYQGLDDFTQAYIEALFWIENEPSTITSDRVTARGAVRKAWAKRVEEGQQKDVPGDYGVSDLAPETFARIVADCKQFQELYADLLTRAYETESDKAYTESSAGHDFYLTRNGHGAGFWDRGLGDVGDELSDCCGWKSRDKAHPFPELDVYVGDDGKVYF